MLTETEFTLGYVLQLHLETHSEVITRLTDIAINEFTLETALDKMSSDMRAYSFEIVPYRDTGTYLLTHTEDLTALLDDQLVMLQTMLSSPYINTFLVSLFGLNKRNIYIYIYFFSFRIVHVVGSQL